MQMTLNRLLAVGGAAVLLGSTPVGGQVAVTRPEGSLHGFLMLRTQDGKRLADGDVLQTARNRSITTRVLFQFLDGSTYDETTVFTQSGHFHVVSDRLIQKGPAFPQPTDLSVDTASGTAVVRYTTDRGEPKTSTEHFTMPPDLANGILPTMLKNVRPEAAPKKVSMIVATPAPRLVRIAISSAGEDTFQIGSSSRRATHYVLKVELGGAAGAIAPLIGRQPPDSHIWISRDDAPEFVRGEQPFFDGAPLWRIELASPTWSK